VECVDETKQLRFSHPNSAFSNKLVVNLYLSLKSPSTDFYFNHGRFAHGNIVVARSVDPYIICPFLKKVFKVN